MKIEKFEDIKAWQEAKILTKMVYEVTSKGKFSKDYGLKDQIRRASTSIMANIAEGFDAQSDAEFIKFLIYARRSTSEVQSHIYVALEENYITKQEFDEIYQKTVEVKNLISGFIRYLKKK